MKSTISIILWVVSTLPFAWAQSNPGPFLVGERDFTFSDSGLTTPTVNTHVYYPGVSAGANVDVAGGIFPVVAFGHGFNLGYLDYSQICAHLAGYGFLVISPDVENGFSVDHLEYAKELAACLSALNHLGSTQGNWASGHVSNRSGVFGHSMGGGASGLVPSVFADIDAVSGLAAAETTPSAVTALSSYHGPLQMISGSEDNVAPEGTNQIPMYHAGTGPKQWVSLIGGAHCKFTDASTICDFVSGSGSITRDRQIQLSERYLTAFFRYFLQNDSTAFPFLCGDSLQADISSGALIAQSQQIPNCQTLFLSKPQANGFVLAPNPVHGICHIQSQEPVEVWNSQGQKLGTFVPVLGEIHLDMAGFPKGLYVIQGLQTARREKILKE